MAVKWTKSQQNVIDTRNKNLLVSAAAGSGKTAVLVERIITMVTDVQNPIDIDKLLVVTFTNAAAAEMRERILNAIEQKAKEQPDNEHIQKQQAYIHNAMIMTIHSFCLNMIRENFDRIEIDPGFRIGDEGELKLLKADIVKEMLEEYYFDDKEEFINFIESYVAGRTDENIEAIILKVFEFSMSYPWPEEWLKKCLENYDTDGKSLSVFQWMQYLNNYINNQLEELKSELIQLIKIADAPDGPYTYVEMLKDDLCYIDQLIEAQHFDERVQMMTDHQFMALSRKRLPEAEEYKKKQVQDGRTSMKKKLSKMKESYYFQSEEEMLGDIMESRKNIEVLIQLTIDFKRRYESSKKENNMIDFNDLEHYALNILVNNENGKIIKTNVAKELSDQFVEIMVDEYQDSNLVQETILSSISKESDGKPNIFMVGDVKQSIYKFRLARPEIFMEKYHNYSISDDALYQRINLDKNFRSRGHILKDINFIFYQIMGKSLGNIDYDRENALYPGAEYYPELPQMQNQHTELLIVDTLGDTEKSKDEEIEYTKIQLEAKAAANRIKELINEKNGYKIIDKKTGHYRTAKYSDIVILLRSLKNWSDIYVDLLMSEGIPAYCESRVGYFNSIEIVTVLSLLSIIDNPLQDIPLAAVLKSPMFGLTSVELARIKIIMGEEKLPFFIGLANYLEQGEDETLICKLKSFMMKLESYRRMVPTTSIYDLIGHVVQDTGYYNYVTAMPSGDRRCANIDILRQKAVDYESTSYVGLFNFVRYIEKLRKYDVDFGEASTVEETDNTVRIISIHKSKGLEFPIVIVAGLSKQFNFMDSYETVVVEPDLGIGLDYRNPVTRIKNDTLIKKSIATKIKLENIGEELRVLYVALTRAKEKLILIGTVKGAKMRIQKWIDKRFYRDTLLSFHTLADTNNYLDWIGYALVRHRSFAWIYKAYGIHFDYSHPLYNDEADFNIKICQADELVYTALKDRIMKDNAKEVFYHWDAGYIYNEEIRKQLFEQLSFEYAYKKDRGIHAKMSVSEIKKAHMEEDDDEVKQLFTPSRTEMIPKFMEEKAPLSGAGRGTAYHRIFELVDFKIEPALDKISEMLDRMLQEGKISKDIIEVVDPEIISTFYRSNLGKRMKEAFNRNKLYREQQFVMGIPADEVEKSYSSDELILVQGIIDVYFEENNELIIADYKTDNVTSMEELLKRYTVQLKYYKKALEQITGMNVKEMIIYSTKLGEEGQVT